MPTLAARAAVLLATLAATGCGQAAKPVPGPVLRVVTGPDGSVPSPYDIGITDGLAVALRGNAGTGYEWQAVALPPIVAQRGSATTACIGDSIPGCAQLTTFEFDLVAPGEGTLGFAYVRPWETGVPPLQTFEIALRVR